MIHVDCPSPEEQKAQRTRDAVHQIVHLLRCYERTPTRHERDRELLKREIHRICAMEPAAAKHFTDELNKL